MGWKSCKKIDIVRILLITAYFPPYRSVASIRPFNWYKELPKHGIDVEVVTPKLPDSFSYHISETNIHFVDISSNKATSKKRGDYSKLSGKFNTLLKLLFKWKNPNYDDYFGLYKAANELLGEKKYDLLIVTGEPYILFKYAYDLHIKHAVNYILDYRDGWNSDHATLKGIHKIIRKSERSKEQKYLTNALNYTVAAEFIREKNNQNFGTSNGFEVENGINLSIFNQLTATKNESSFTITYTGSLYPEHDISSFLNAASKLNNEVGNIIVEFIGVDIKPSITLEELKQFQLKNEWVKIIPPVENKDSLQYQLNADLLLKFDFTGQAYGLLGAKLYEYAATRNKIMTVLSVNDKRTTFFPNRDIQILCFGVEEIYRELKNCYTQWSIDKQLISDINTDEITELSSEFKIEKFASWLKLQVNNVQ